MTNKSKKANELQGDEVADKKEQKASVSYALKAVSKHLDVINKAGLISDPTHALINQEIVAAKKEYAKREFGLE